MIEAIEPDVRTKRDLCERASARFGKLMQLQVRARRGEIDRPELVEVAFHLARRTERGRLAGTMKTAG